MLDEQHVAMPAALDEEDVRRIVQSELERAGRDDGATKKAAFIASKGTLDWAYPPLILATTAAASGMDASIFFTFYGLNIIHKDFERLLKVSPLGNPAMPMPVTMPNFVLGLPGMGPMATQMMKAKFRGKHVAGIGELLESAQDLGVRMIACQMTMDVFGYAADDFLDGVEFAGAAAFLAEARQAHVTLFI
ncbi:MAG TPA: DsrE/DsrF/DrsH-like family protein [Gaiellaceae bacterium]|jgi:peroxiredoxin family protein|nr:DsrE/DsrF/DrsH-like family protein [Gaiellaceae bacterium]